MKRPRSAIIVAAFAIGMLATPVTAQQASETDATVVVLVRHAERQDSDGDDPGLSPAGEERAATLAHVLSHLDVDAIYTSQFRRTRETAVPLASATGLTPEVVDARDMPALLERVRGGPHRTIVVIGHSNTVPAIARALGAPAVGDISEGTYDDMLVVRLAGDVATLMHFKYGRPTP
ncbi:MAG: phosphoglycerate mutase family protein [Gemmatimonadota bacterium]|nr:phosphoglycerate mutase family protein [Gemmatimonadota bacterium]